MSCITNVLLSTSPLSCFLLLDSICGFYTFTFLKFYRFKENFQQEFLKTFYFFSNLFQQTNGAGQIFAGAPWGSAGASRRPSSGPESGRSSALAAALLPVERSNRCICKKFNFQYDETTVLVRYSTSVKLMQISRNRVDIFEKMILFH
jgi:hypothetical protein